MLRDSIPRRFAGGFTLIELIVVLAILSILSAVAVPGMMGLVRDARLSSYTDLLVNSLNTARIEAIKQRRDITVCPAADPNAATACGADAALWSNGAMIFDGAEVIRREPFQGGVVVNTESIGVVFAGTIGSTTAAAFTLCASGRSQQVVNVLASGRVSKQVNSAVTCG